MSHLNPGLLSAYNSLTDRHLTGYFNNTRIRRHLQRVGLITRSGRIVPDKEYRHKLIQRTHQRHVRECLAQAIFYKVLDMERVHQIEIKRRLEEFARRERVHKIKVDRSKRYDEEVIHILSPRPPTGPRRSHHAQHSGPEGEHTESSESPGSSRPNTAPGNMQRPVRLKPIHSTSTTATQRHRYPDRRHDSSNDTDQPHNCTMDKSSRMHLTTSEFSRGISPYRLPVINNFVTPVPPPTKRNDRGFKGSPSGTLRGRRLRPTTAPIGPGINEETPVLRSSVQQSNVGVRMVFFGKTVHLSHDLLDMRDEVKVFQQHCGGENLCVYKGRLQEGETFQFVSRRHRGFPFSLTFFLNGLQVERLSSCCEFKHRKGSRLGGRHGQFGFSSVEGASPCYRCIIAMGLDKKPTPPPKRLKEDLGSEATVTVSPSGTNQEAEEEEEEEEERAGKDSGSPKQDMEAEVKEDSPPAEDKAREDYEEDFEAEEEGPAEDGELSEKMEKEEEDGAKEDHSDSEEDNKDEERRTSSESSSSSSEREDSETEADPKEDQVPEPLTDPSETEPEETPMSAVETEPTENSSPTPPHTSSTPTAKDTDAGDSLTNSEGRAEPEESDTSQPSEVKGDGEEVIAGVQEGESSEQAESTEEEEPERAKSVQEKLAEAFLKESQCSSEPELSDTSTEEEEESTDTTQQQENKVSDPAKSVTFTLQRKLCFKIVEKEESSTSAPEVACDQQEATNERQKEQGEPSPEPKKMEEASGCTNKMEETEKDGWVADSKEETEEKEESGAHPETEKKRADDEALETRVDRPEEAAIADRAENIEEEREDEKTPVGADVSPAETEQKADAAEVTKEGESEEEAGKAEVEETGMGDGKLETTVAEAPEEPRAISHAESPAAYTLSQGEGEGEDMAESSEAGIKAVKSRSSSTGNEDTMVHVYSLKKGTAGEGVEELWKEENKSEDDKDKAKENASEEADEDAGKSVRNDINEGVTDNNLETEESEQNKTGDDDSNYDRSQESENLLNREQNEEHKMENEEKDVMKEEDRLEDNTGHGTGGGVNAEEGAKEEKHEEQKVEDAEKVTSEKEEAVENESEKEEESERAESEIKHSEMEEAEDKELEKCESEKGETPDEKEAVKNESEVKELEKCESEKGETPDEKEAVKNESEVKELEKCESQKGEHPDEKESVKNESEVKELEKCESQKGEHPDEKESVKNESEVKELEKCESQKGETPDEKEAVKNESEVKELEKCEPEKEDYSDEKETEIKESEDKELEKELVEKESEKEGSVSEKDQEEKVKEDGKSGDDGCIEKEESGGQQEENERKNHEKEIDEKIFIQETVQDTDKKVNSVHENVHENVEDQDTLSEHHAENIEKEDLKMDKVEETDKGIDEDYENEVEQHDTDKGSAHITAEDTGIIEEANSKEDEEAKDNETDAENRKPTSDEQEDSQEDQAESTLPNDNNTKLETAEDRENEERNEEREEHQPAQTEMLERESKIEASDQIPSESHKDDMESVGSAFEFKKATSENQEFAEGEKDQDVKGEQSSKETPAESPDSDADDFHTNVSEVIVVSSAPQVQSGEPTTMETGDTNDKAEDAKDKSHSIPDSNADKPLYTDAEASAMSLSAVDDGTRDDTEEASKPSEEGESVVVKPQVLQRESISGKEVYVQNVEDEEPSLPPESSGKEYNRQLVTNWVTVHQTSNYFETFVDDLNGLNSDDVANDSNANDSTIEPKEMTEHSTPDSLVKLLRATDDSAADGEISGDEEEGLAMNNENQSSNNTIVEAIKADLSENLTPANDEPREPEHCEDNLEVKDEIGDSIMSTVDTHKEDTSKLDEGSSSSKEHKEIIETSEPAKITTKMDTAQTDTSKTDVESIGSANNSAASDNPESAIGKETEREWTKRPSSLDEEPTTVTEVADLLLQSQTKDELDRASDSQDRLSNPVPIGMETKQPEDTKDSKETKEESTEVTELTDLRIPSSSDNGSQEDSESMKLQPQEQMENDRGENKDVTLIEETKSTLSKDQMSTLSVGETPFFGRTSYPLFTSTRTEGGY